MIAGIREALRAAGYDPSPEEIADIIWLATTRLCRAAAPDAPTSAVSEPDSPSTGAHADGVAAPDDETEGRPIGTPNESGRLTLYAPAGWSDAVGAPVRHTRIATPRGITNARALARSLRPLRSTVRSRNRFELDIAATIDTIADGFKDVVLRPVREPRLDLTLVVDDGASMAIWHDVAHDLHQSFHRLRAFRRTRLLGMNTDDPLGPSLTTEPFRRRASRAAVPLGERNLLLVVSDGVGPAWQTGAVQNMLTHWARKSATAILQVLAQEMWPGTGLPTQRLMAAAPGPAVANHHLRLRHPRLPQGLLPVPSPPIPVIDLVTGTSGVAWARMVGAPAGEVGLHFFDEGQLSDGALSAQPPDPSPEESIEEFLDYASDSARRLAAHLACAGTALTVPLMRLVQRSAVPDSGPEHLAEVFLAGMLIPCGPRTAENTDAAAPPPPSHELLPWNRRAYAFPPMVAHSLRELVKRSDELATHQYVTRYLARERETATAGMALVTDQGGVLRAGPDVPPLGEVVRQGTASRHEGSLDALARKLDLLLDRIGAPRLDWLAEALERRAAVVDHQSMRRQLTELTAREPAVDDPGERGQLLRSLVSLARELGCYDIATTYEELARTLTRRASAPYFFLSYAPVPRFDGESNPNVWVERFFRDVCGRIASLTATRAEDVGVADFRMPTHSGGLDQVFESIASCRVFVPLYTPRYFLSEHCGKQWFAFAQRNSRHRASTGRPSQAIVPALWVPVEESALPDAAMSLQIADVNFGGVYRDEGFYGLIKLKYLRDEYEAAVLGLARRIVSVAENADLPPGEPQPYESTPNAFALPRHSPDTEFTGVDRRSLLEEVASIYRDASRARILLEEIGFPAQLIPLFTSPLEFWNGVFTELAYGVISTPYRRILEVAFRTYGHNSTLRDLAERHGLTSDRGRDEPDIPLTQEDRRKLLDLLPLLYASESKVRLLLDSIGFPSAWLNFSVSPQDLWLQVFDRLTSGIVPTPYRQLLEFICREYPANPTGRELAQHYGLSGTQHRLGSTAGGDRTCHVVFIAGSEEEREVGYRALTAEGYDAEEVWTTTHAISFRVNETDPNTLNSRLDGTSISWTVVPPHLPDYLLGRLEVEGPDGRSWPFTDVPVIMTVGEVVAGALEQYSPRPSEDRLAVIKHVEPNGESYRMDPAATLEEARVRSGDRLRVDIEPPPRAPSRRIRHDPDPAEDA
ncbi:TIR-like protein FxsC [Streptomyces sp. NPDC029004]|uniref:TIR-like protein FxsC n=1 Tax=Streptomyces sp. NPDC029004 TaxID=3154490 RepID=UPI0033E6B1A7